MPCPIIGRDPVDTERKLNVHKTPWTSSERLIYVQFTSCVYGGSLIVSDLCSETKRFPVRVRLLCAELTSLR